MGIEQFYRKGVLARLVVATVAIAGLAGTVLAKDQKKVFVFPRENGFKNLDPVKQFDQESSNIIYQIYDGLMSYHYLKRPYELTPALLAKMPEAKKKEPLTYVFELRKGIKFHPDTCFKNEAERELTTDDVIYSLKRFADARENTLSYTLMEGFIKGIDDFHAKTGKGKVDYSKLDIAGIKKIDKYKMEVTLTRENPLAFYPLAASQLSIVSKKIGDCYKGDFERHQVGTGPFIMKDLSRRGTIVLVKNPDYWDTYPTEGEPGDKEKGLLAEAGKKLPLIDELQMPLIEEAQPRMLNLLKGKVDFIRIDKDNFSRMVESTGQGKFKLKKPYSEQLNLSVEPYMSIDYFTFNMKDSVVGGLDPKKKALRQAIAYAIDTKAYVEKLRNGRGLVLTSIVPVPVAGSQRDIPMDYLTYNVEMAKKKLAEAGYPGGKGLPPITLEFRAATTTRQDFEFFRNMGAQIGIQFKPSYQTFSAFLRKIESGNFQIALDGWFADYPDAENFYMLLYSKNMAPGPNRGFYDNPKYDKLYETIRYMKNGPERFELFKKLNEIIKEDVPMYMTWDYIEVSPYSKWVKNFKRNLQFNPPAKYVDIDMGLKAKGM